MSVFQCSISHCCVQLHSCSHLVLLIPLGLQKCLDSPLHYPTFPLIPCSLPTLLTLFFPSLLSKLLGLCCTNPESCFEVLDLAWVDGEALRGKGKELPPEWGTGSLAVEGEGQWEIETEVPRGLLNAVSTHPSPSSFGELLLQPSLGHLLTYSLPFAWEKGEVIDFLCLETFFHVVDFKSSFVWGVCHGVSCQIPVRGGWIRAGGGLKVGEQPWQKKVNVSVLYLNSSLDLYNYSVQAEK